jgi:hypothetical protein
MWFTLILALSSQSRTTTILSAEVAAATFLNLEQSQLHAVLMAAAQVARFGYDHSLEASIRVTCPATIRLPLRCVLSLTVVTLNQTLKARQHRQQLHSLACIERVCRWSMAIPSVLGGVGWVARRIWKLCSPRPRTAECHHHQVSIESLPCPFVPPPPPHQS